MVRVFADGDGRHRLEDLAGRHIGWVRLPVIGFQGFRTERHALTAAEEAWRALETVLRRAYIGRPPSAVVAGSPRVVRDGDTEWISDGRTTLARLVRPAGGGARPPSFAIELELPSYANEGVAITAAHVMAGVVQALLWMLEDAPSPLAPLPRRDAEAAPAAGGA